MNDGTNRDRTRHGRGFRPAGIEALEGRELLSTVPVLRAHGHVSPPLPGPPHPVATITGQVSGSAASQGLYGGKAVTDSGFSGSGTLRQFGGVLFGMTARITPSTTTPGAANFTNGDGLIVTSKGGNQLRLSFTGTSIPTRGGKDSWILAGNVTGGTGRFNFATGTFNLTGTAARGGYTPFNLNLIVRLNPPR